VRALGVIGMNLLEGDFIVGGEVFSQDDNPAVVIATNRGAVKKMKLSEFEKSARAKRGVVMLRELRSNPHRIAGLKLLNDDPPINVLSDQGVVEIILPSQFRFNDRYSNGSFILDEKESGQITRIWVDPDTETS